MIFRYKKLSIAMIVSISMLSSLVLAHEGHHHPDMPDNPGMNCPQDNPGMDCPQDNTTTSPSTAAHALYSGKDAAFLTKMDVIMVDMHKGMSAAVLTGNKDVDFMRMMIPHHQGAIDMAKLILESSQDKAVINLALSIITEQENEITLMHKLIEETHHVQ